jgi:murein DD-endopeptidase MepM/ murein hydrolase activator NlpD
MPTGRVAIVIIDPQGRNVRRLRLSLRTCHQLLLGTLGLLAVVALLGLHSLHLRPAAAQSVSMHQQNVRLSAEVDHLEAQLPLLRRSLRHTDGTFAQLWEKSGLAGRPRHLSIGPLEASRGHNSSGGGLPAPGGEQRLQGLDPRIYAAQQPAATKGKTELAGLLQGLQGVHDTLDSTLEYFHDAHRRLANTPSIRPAQTPWLTSSFGRRLDPIFNIWLMHKGLDLGGHIGMEIFAPADGVVIWVGSRGGYGQTVVLDHGYGLQSHYAHLSKYLVSVGDSVHRGEPIAQMGTTGKSTGPHLHYEVRRNGQPLNPRYFILD